ncbi:MAG: hypothetical protein ACNA8H_11340, partial [Anaerolineales bacterium]
MKPLLEKRNEYLKKVKGKGFTDCASDMKQLVKACERLFTERKKQTEPALERYGRNLFKVKVTRGEWTGTREQDFLDEVTLSVLVGSRYRPFDRLSTGERNAAMMVLLMNQGAFGPLIIDEPEQYLDVSSITGML